jgi:ribosomal protein S18 acetylase RimI-like enzyme
MGTHPDHRRKGLAKALICEGLRRLEKFNPSLIYINGAAYTEEANRLYEATGFTGQQLLYHWDKQLK